MNETSKLNQYRKESGYDSFFYGHGIDIGCGPDILNRSVFTNIESCFGYDIAQGDANLCHNLEGNSFDFVYSSHCLEHMVDAELALKNWIRICKPGGHIIVAVPHEVYYEKNIWPSQFNQDHKHSFRMEQHTILPSSIFVPAFLSRFPVEVVSCLLLISNFDFSRFWEDQTIGSAICQIEFILKKVNHE